MTFDGLTSAEVFSLNMVISCEQVDDDDVPDPSDLALSASQYHLWLVSGTCHHLQCSCCLFQPPLQLQKMREKKFKSENVYS